MTAKELAEKLTGREYGEEITPDECNKAKAAGLVVVFGASDDLVEFRGAFDDEIGIGRGVDGGMVLLDKNGILPDRDQIDDDSELEKFFARKKGNLSGIEVLWCKEKGYSWTYRTTVSHATFEIVEGEEKYCRGIVFSVADL